MVISCLEERVIARYVKQMCMAQLRDVVVRLGAEGSCLLQPFATQPANTSITTDTAHTDPTQPSIRRLPQLCGRRWWHLLYRQVWSLWRGMHLLYRWWWRQGMCF